MLQVTRLVLAFIFLASLTAPAFAQDTFLTVQDSLGASYVRPLTDCPTNGITYTRSTNSFGCVSASSAPAAGSNTQVQFNDSGVLGGDAGFVYDKTANVITLTGGIAIGTTLSGNLTVDLLSTYSGAVATARSLRSLMTMTLTGTSSVVGFAHDVSIRVDQAGFNATAAGGFKAIDAVTRAQGASGTVTQLVGVSGSTQNTGAGIVTFAASFLTSGPTNSGGGSIGAWSGYQVSSHTAAATAEYGYRGIMPAASNVWHLYMDGTAQNYLAGNLGIGTGKSVALTVLDVADVSTNAVRGIITGQYSASADGGRLIGRKARGTAAVPVVVTTGDTLASWIGEGYDGASYLQMGAILISSTGTIASTRVPTTMVFKTATDAAPSVLTTALTIGADQSATFLTLAGTGAATGKTVVCADTNGKIYRSSSGVACAN